MDGRQQPQEAHEGGAAIRCAVAHLHGKHADGCRHQGRDEWGAPVRQAHGELSSQRTCMASMGVAAGSRADALIGTARQGRWQLRSAHLTANVGGGSGQQQAGALYSRSCLPAPGLASNGRQVQLQASGCQAACCSLCPSWCHARADLCPRPAYSTDGHRPRMAVLRETLVGSRGAVLDPCPRVQGGAGSATHEQLAQAPRIVHVAFSPTTDRKHSHCCRLQRTCTLAAGCR